MTKQVKKNFPMIQTPIGEMEYPWLTKTDDKFSNGQPGQYKLNLVCDLGDPEVQAVIDIIDEHLDGGKPPYDIDEDNGKIKFRAKSGAEYPPKLFDSKGKRLDPKTTSIWGGSMGRMKARINVYDAFGGGVNLRLNAVQVTELVEVGGGFDAVEGGYESSEESFDSTTPQEDTTVTEGDLESADFN